MNMPMQASIMETKQLWENMDKPHVFLQTHMLKTHRPVSKMKFMKGGSVNVTLLFAVMEFCKVVQAYFDDIEKLLAQGTVVQNVNSVASYFLSCVESLVDPLMETCLLQGGSEAEVANKHLSEIATASTKQAYEYYRETFGLEMFHALQTDVHNTRSQLWSCMCCKHPSYSDIKFMHELIESESLPPSTSQALVVYRANGESRRRLSADLQNTLALIERLQQLGVSACNFPQREEDKGDDPFQKPFNKLMDTITSEEN